MDKIECTKCDKEFSSKEALEMHNNAKHYESVKKPVLASKHKKKIKIGIYIIIVLGIIFGIVSLISSGVKTLPPTDMQGHIEEWPSTQVLKTPIPITIFKHILEHSDTQSKRPGVIISYNCEDYECGQGLIESLEEFATEYDYVYVAPFPKIDAKIVITKLGKQIVLEEYNKYIIQEFIER